MYSTQAIAPDVAREHDVTPSRAGLGISVAIAAPAVGAWFWGPLSDRIGRRVGRLVLGAAVGPDRPPRWCYRRG